MNFLDRFDSPLWLFGPVSLSWYGVCFFVGLVLSAAFFFARIGKNPDTKSLSSGEAIDIALALAFGAIFGARTGFVVLYQPGYFLENPLAIISPFDGETGEWVGISGMSAFGGMMGAALALLVLSRRRRLPFLSLLDEAAFAAPIGIFFGRIGNFLTGELFGRATSVPWAIVFPRSSDGLVRHPSQLYEALGEGGLLFLTLFLLSKRLRAPGGRAAIALIFYGVIRGALEFFREPDANIGFIAGVFTLGQTFSVLAIVTGGGFLVWIRHRENAILSKRESARLGLG